MPDPMSCRACGRRTNVAGATECSFCGSKLSTETMAETEIRGAMLRLFRLLSSSQQISALEMFKAEVKENLRD